MVHERIPNATPNKNAHIESWHSVLEADCLGNQVFSTLAAAYEAVAAWITYAADAWKFGGLAADAVLSLGFGRHRPAHQDCARLTSPKKTAN